MCYGFDAQTPLEQAAERRGLGRRRLLQGALGTAAVGAFGFGSAGVAAAAPAKSGKGADAGTKAARPGKRKVPPGLISIQLYSIRDDLAKNYDKSLRHVADTGYRKVELAGYYGRTAKQLRRFHDRVGVQATSSHDGLSNTRDDLNAKIENAATLGQRYIVVPGVNSDKSDDWKRFAYQLNSEAAAASHAGIRYGYHNHAHEFLPLSDGKRPWDIFMAELDPVLMHLEVDLCWIYAGAVESGDGVDDPIAYVNDHINDAPLKVRQYHVKDWDRESGDTLDLGTGEIDFTPIFANHQVEEYIMENDTPDVTPVQTVEVGYDYLRALRF